MASSGAKSSVFNLCLLHTRADRALRTIINEQLEPFKLTLMEWLLLGAAGEAPKKGLSLSSIAQRLEVSQPQITALMDKVLAKKFVRQKVPSSDRRGRLVALTPKGTKLLGDVEVTIKNHLNKWLNNGSSPEIKAYLENILRQTENPPDVKI